MSSISDCVAAVVCNKRHLLLGVDAADATLLQLSVLSPLCCRHYAVAALLSLRCCRSAAACISFMLLHCSLRDLPPLCWYLYGGAEELCC
jgi:hypothetical protein